MKTKSENDRDLFSTAEQETGLGRKLNRVYSAANQLLHLLAMRKLASSTQRRCVPGSCGTGEFGTAFHTPSLCQFAQKRPMKHIPAPGRIDGRHRWESWLKKFVAMVFPKPTSPDSISNPHNFSPPTRKNSELFSPVEGSGQVFRKISRHY